MAKRNRDSVQTKKMRRFARKLALFGALGFILFAAYANWFVRQPDAYLDEMRGTLPGFISRALFGVGEICADLTDSFALTGSDAVCDAPPGHNGGDTFFAGIPMPATGKAPKDITVVDKGEFTIAYSDTLRHPVWCAYKVPAEALFSISTRPNFKKDRDFKSCPAASSYARTGYDRGHMVPNHAITTRYGLDAQKKTFLMTNIAPQTPELNRGVWREVEHRIADLFTARWGDAWVIVGAICDSQETLSGTDINVPTAFYQIIAAESDGKIRVLALLFGQEVPWGAWPRHYITSVDRIEEASGFDFFRDLEDSAEDKLESTVPTRLWPIRFFDAFKALKIHLNAIKSDSI